MLAGCPGTTCSWSLVISQEKEGKKNQPISVAFAFVPAKPPLCKAGAALLVTCGSLLLELGAGYPAEGTSCVSGIPTGAGGAVWSLRYLL